jgi:hypothetical protein
LLLRRDSTNFPQVSKELTKAQQDFANQDYMKAFQEFREFRDIVLKKSRILSREVALEQLLNAFTGLTKSSLQLLAIEKNKQQQTKFLDYAKHYADKASSVQFKLNRNRPCVALKLYEDEVRSK